MSFKNMILGVILIILGVILLLEKLGVLTGQSWDYVWPILIVVLGVWIVAKHNKKKILQAREKFTPQNPEDSQ